VVASESKGYGANGGTVNHRVYHVPMLHRTYDHRNSKPTYTYYAIGLGTVAHPGVIKPGVVFPDFITTGAHTANNPTLLVLEECRKCWPGLHISALIRYRDPSRRFFTLLNAVLIVPSIGTGAFDLERSYLTPLVEDAAKAVLKIGDDNRKLADEIKKYMTPFDKTISNAYFRFDIPIMNTFYEYAQKSKIHADLTSWFDEPKVRTQFGSAAAIFKTNNFPTSPEDLVALASLSSLMRALSIAGYSFESLIVSDIITNYILYESASENEGSFRKLGIAFEAERLASVILAKHKAYVDGNKYPLPDDVHSEAALIYGVAAYDDPGHRENRQTGQLLTIFDYVAAIYYCLQILREGDKSKLDEPRMFKYMKQFSFVLDTPQITDPLIVDKLNEILEVGAISAMCEAASVQLLRNVKSLAYNGSFIRQIKHVVREIDLQGMDEILVEPIANMYALWMENKVRYEDIDDGIATILMAAPHNTSLNNSWALVNLAVKRTIWAKPEDFKDLDDSDVVSRCLKLRISRAGDWNSKHIELLVPAVQRGWFGLAEKGLSSRELNSSKQFEKDDNFIYRADVALKEAVKAGYPFVMKKFLEGMSVELWKNRISIPDSQGLTPYHLACKHRAPKEVFRLIQVLTTEKNHKDNNGRTPLSYCFPKQDEVPPVYQSVVDMITEFSLPTITPTDKPKAYGGHYRGNPKRVDPRTESFRLILDQLLCRNANPILEDDSGMTPAHRAAKEGWGDNLDVFFMYKHGEFPRWTDEMLNMLDNENRSILDYARLAGNRGDIQGREDIVEDEMEKRNIPIPERMNLTTGTLQGQWITIPIGRPRPPANPQPAAPPVSTEDYTTELPQQPIRPPEVHVYQDPSILSTRPANATPSLAPPSHATRFSPPQVPLIQLLQYFHRDKYTRIQVFQQTQTVRQVTRCHLLLQYLGQRRYITTQISRRVPQVDPLLPIYNRGTAQHHISSILLTSGILRRNSTCLFNNTLQTNSYPLINNTFQIHNTKSSNKVRRNSRKARTKGSDQGSSGSL
jgi:hypothetical protein